MSATRELRQFVFTSPLSRRDGEWWLVVALQESGLALRTTDVRIAKSEEELASVRQSLSGRDVLNVAGFGADFLWTRNGGTFEIWRAVGFSRLVPEGQVRVFNRYRSAVLASKENLAIRGRWHAKSVSVSQIRGVKAWTGLWQLRSGLSAIGTHGKRVLLLSGMNWCDLIGTVDYAPWHDIDDDRAWTQSIGKELAEFLGVSWSDDRERKLGTRH